MIMETVLDQDAPLGQALLEGTSLPFLWNEIPRYYTVFDYILGKKLILPHSRWPRRLLHECAILSNHRRHSCAKRFCPTVFYLTLKASSTSWPPSENCYSP